MPFKIQRAARPLGDLLSIFGGQTPGELEDRIRAGIECLQFYGNRQVLTAANAAVAEGNVLTLTPIFDVPIVLFGMQLTMTFTATISYFRGAVAIRYNGLVANEVGMHAEDVPIPAPGESGTANIVWRAPFPLVLPPRTTLIGRPSSIGTDATANLVLGADIAVLG